MPDYVEGMDDIIGIRQSFKKKVINRMKCYRSVGNKNDNENIHWLKQFGYHCDFGEIYVILAYW